MNRHLYIPLLISTAAIALFVWVTFTMSIVWLFVPAVIIAYIVYLNTFYKQVPKPERILPLYLFLLGIQFLHFTEEYLSGFTEKLPALFNEAAYPVDYWVTFNMVAYFIFILGGIILFKEKKEYLIIPLFFLLAAVIFNAIAHILTSIYVGDYFPGLYTALIYAAFAPIVIKRIVETRKRSFHS